MDNNTDNNNNHNVGSATPRQQDATITEAKAKSMEMTAPTTIAAPPSLSVFFMPSDLLSSLVPQSQLEGTIPEDTLETQSKSETSTSVTAPAVVSSLNSVVPSCRICGITRFENVERQREHVKLDWHRYNLKQQLMDKKATPITEQQFENMIQDLSSISGSDDDHEDDDTSDNDSSNNRKNNNNSSSRKNTDDGNNGGQEALVRSLMAKLEVSIMDNERTRHQDPALIYRQKILEQQLQEAKASPLIWFTSAVYGPTVHLGIYKNALPNKGHCDNLTEYLRTLQFPEVHIAKKQKNNRARREAKRIAAEQDDAAAQGVSSVKEDSTQQQQHLTTTKQEPANVDVGQLEQSRANNPEKIDGIDDIQEEDEIENEQDWIQYQMMAKQQQPTAAVKSASQPRYWTLVMLGGGHFAGVVMDLAGQVSPHGRDMKIVARKTFHRYTVRKKQGGSQASHGVANSAGARIRMYNEEALKQEVRELLDGWSHWITQSECVFVHAPGNNRKVLFYDNSVMSTVDRQGRLRSIPFVTRRPTLSELKRAYQELTSVKVSVLSKQALQQKEREEQQASLFLQEIEASKKAATTTKGQDSSSSNKGTQLAEAPPELLKLIELVKKGRTDAMSNHLLKYGMDPSQLLPLTSSTEYDIRRTPTILHLASHHGQAQVVKCLLEKHHVDPTTTTVSAAQNSLTETEAETGEDPSSPMVGTNSFTAYDVAKDKETRNAFRRAMALFPDDWDWVGLAHVPSALTPEMEAEQERKAKEKTRKLLEAERERKKTRETNRPAAAPVGNSGASSSSTSTSSPLAKNLASVSAAHSQLSPELRMRLERERRAAAAEARMAAMKQTETIRRAVQEGKNVCVACGKSLDGLMPFDKFGRKFCTTECVAKGPA